MQIQGIESYDLLTTQQHKDLAEYAQKKRIRISDLIVHEYEWLKSDFKENRWIVINNKGQEYQIEFDSLLPNGNWISDNRLLIEDIKLLFVTAKHRKLKIVSH